MRTLLAPSPCLLHGMRENVRHQPRCYLIESDDPADAPDFRGRRNLRLSKMLFDSLVRSSLTWDMEGTQSQTTLIETRIGTDNKAPGMPQSQVQSIKETNMTTGLSVKRRLAKKGGGSPPGGAWIGGSSVPAREPRGSATVEMSFSRGGMVANFVRQRLDG